MLRLLFDIDDLAATRFAISPMVEVTTSLQRRRFPGTNPATAPWEATIEERVRDLDRTLLDALVGYRRRVPDFLTPFPHTPEAAIAVELEAVAGTSPARVRSDLEAVHEASGLPPVLRRGLRAPRKLLGAIVALVGEYWEAALAPDWSSMHAVLANDIEMRSRMQARGGLAALLADLHPLVTFERGTIRLDIADHLHHSVAVAGTRLPLVPSIFAARPLCNISPELPPLIMYPARGSALTWERPAPVPESLSALLGRGRARVLVALSAPADTTGLAALLGVTPGAVSQHLSVLSGARLATGSRQGRRVLYRRTKLGDRLVGDV